MKKFVLGLGVLALFGTASAQPWITKTPTKKSSAPITSSWKAQSASAWQK